MNRIKAHDLRKRDETYCTSELTRARKELASLRVSKVSSQPQVKLSKIKVSQTMSPIKLFPFSPPGRPSLEF